MHGYSHGNDDNDDDDGDDNDDDGTPVPMKSAAWVLIYSIQNISGGRQITESNRR